MDKVRWTTYYGFLFNLTEVTQRILMRIATTCYNLSAKLIRYRLRIIEGIERNAIRKIDRRYRKGANHAA